VKLHVSPYVPFKILQFVKVEKPIANSRDNQDHLVLALQERLRDFGLTKNESKIYVFLSKHGPKKPIEISREEKIPRTETKAKGIITPSIQRPTVFSALTIEKAIESILHDQQKKIEELKILKHDMIVLWYSFQNMRNYTKPEISKFESAVKKYAKSRQFRLDFKRNLKKMRQKSFDIIPSQEENAIDKKTIITIIESIDKKTSKNSKCKTCGFKFSPHCPTCQKRNHRKFQKIIKGRRLSEYVWFQNINTSSY
jgi:sugar-specific transcriptional regulator TrmB